MKDFSERKEALLKQLEEETKQPVCLALSGGVDSALLAALIGKYTKKNGTKAYGVTFDTVLHPAADLPAAQQAAKDSGLIHKIIKTNELEIAEIQNNPKDRCYICKKGLFEHLQKFASDHGITTIYEGTNQDDLSQYRPGLKAVQELGVKSPLLQHKITKSEIRAWASELGITAATRPSSPCMATRLPYGTPLELSTLRKIEAAEEALKELGFSIVRVRLHGEVVRLEFPKENLKEALEKSQLIINLLKALNFKYITLDLEGFRSGSMDL
ncbi:MAG: ATP-dependent sacrificial sulfur transferase LarE [Clostridiales bacterium]|nr:ATP-dependent sacrificial sulfur transferase LarE [Clostridiales bacterium]